MTLQYTTIDESSFAYGIDARSAENQLKQGFVRDLVNADIIEGRIKKRKGFATYGGELPLRVLQYKTVNSTPAKVSFTFDGSVDLARLTATPILAYGRSSTITSGPFNTTTDTAQYFTNWVNSVRKRYLANTTGSISATATEHGIPTNQMFVNVSRSTNTGANLSSEELFEGNSFTYEVEISQATNDITIGYTNGTNTPIDTFLYYADQTSTSAINYTSTFTVASNTTLTTTIPATTHQLQSYNIIYQLWENTGSTYVKVRPSEFVIETATTMTATAGDVKITITNGKSTTTTYRLILSVVPASNVADPNIQQGINTFTFPGIISPFIFYTLYIVSGTTLTEVWPDSFTYDDTTHIASLSFTNSTAGAIAARLYYSYGTLRTNEIQVDVPGTVSDAVDTAPQMTVWGLSHSIIYGNDKEVNRRGWVNHIDSYRSSNQTRMVAGLGGSLFAARTVAEMPPAFAATMPTYYPKLNARLAAATKIGPVFWEIGEAPNLDRGSISFNGGGTNWAKVTRIAYMPTSNRVSYYLSAPGLTKVGNPITVDQDYVTIKGMSNSRHNGVFKIKYVSYTPAIGLVYLEVENPAITSSDYDDTGTAGLAGIFTDSITTTTSSPFLPGDLLLSSFWDGEVNLIVNAIDGTKTVIENVYDFFSLGGGLVIAGQRTSKRIFLRTAANIGSVLNLVVGDTIFYSESVRPFQIEAVNIANNSITLTEELTWSDSLSAPPYFTVPQRWLPAESPKPDSSDVLLPATVTRHLASNPYDNQPFLRSVMVQNNMYLTNGSDEVYKYDGTSFYRAGVIPWQPGLFVTTEDTTVGGIPLLPFTPVTVSGVFGSKLEITKADSFKFSEGSVYKYADSNVTQYLTLSLNEEDTAGSGSTHYLSFKEPLQFNILGTAPTLTLVYEARYAFRLNIKDVNGVTIASAVTGAGDFVVRLAPPTIGHSYIVHLRLVGLPAWDQYDYSNKNIELQIYRTLWTTSSITPIFYQVATKALTYTGIDGYVDFQDQLSNTTLTDVDPVVSVLSPETIPAGWDEPARAKYITSAGNRLVLANVVDWPTLAITYYTANILTSSAYSGQKFLFRRSSSDTGTTTDMLNRVTYELRNTSGVTVTALTAGSPTGFTFECTPASAPFLGDWVYLSFDNPLSHPLSCSGWWQISAVIPLLAGAYRCTINTAAGITVPVIANHPMHALFATNHYDVPVNIDGDANMGMVNGAVTTSLAPTPGILRRLGMAINATMRMVDTNMSVGLDKPYSTFKPWIVARSESDTQGQLIVKQPRAEIATPAVTIIGGPTDVTYVNGSKVTTSGSPTVTPALTTPYPSRILVSYNNYPEIFDNPFTVNDDLSASAIDINSSDGQEITGVIPFFGESAFGAALQSGVIVVFKQNSIYLVDLSEKRAGRNPVQRIETQGLGCTAPYSIAPTKDGIAFANDSGIYVLRRNQRIEYLGRYVERLWQQAVDKNWLDLVQGHHYNVGRQYKLSVPLLAESSSSYAQNSEVYVYNHTNEGVDEPGGWGRYTGHYVTGWANLYQDAFYATVNGAVKRLRVEGVPEDYRDDNAAIEAVLTTRATDFGQAGIRKVVSHVMVNYRTGGVSDSTYVEVAPDLRAEFDETTAFTVVNYPVNDGISSLVGQDIRTIRHSLARRRCVYMTVQISNSGIDEDLEVAGMSFVVSGLNSKGIIQAASTKK